MAIAVPQYGSNVTDASGKVVGQAKFNPNTGQALQAPSSNSSGGGVNVSGGKYTASPELIASRGGEPSQAILKALYSQGNTGVTSGGVPSSSSPSLTTPSTAPNNAQVNPPNAQQPPSGYTGPSIVDALSLGGQPSDFASRAKMAEAQGIQNYTGTADQNTSLLQQYRAGFANAKGTAPTTSSEGSAGVAQNLPSTPPDTTQAQAVLDDNKAHQQYLDDYKTAQDTSSQRESLVSEYQRLSKDSGIPELNTELMNMKNVINGTEQDIRDEVNKAGGFATNSQVLSLASARNKTLISNYNDLLETRTNLQNNLNTMIGLAEQDRAFASAQIDKQLNFDQQNIQFADKAVANSQSALDSMQKSEGWDGIYKAALASGDPQAIGRINSTMGNGFDLATMAQFDAQTRAMQLAKDNATLANTAADNARASQALAETIRHNKADEANSANKPSNDLLTPGQADVSKVMSALESADKTTKDSVDTAKLRTDPTYFYWIKGQLGQ